VARAVLLAGAIAWGVGGVAAVTIAVVGVESLERLLPPLAIDTDALRGAILAGAVALGIGAVLHGAVLLGLRRHRPRAWTAGILLAALLAATFAAMAAAAFTSAIATPASAPGLVGAGATSAVVAIGYAVVTAGLVGEKRSGAPI
jgi:heme/copper-type cytochrome/quinol oxidase subunit 3